MKRNAADGLFTKPSMMDGHDCYGYLRLQANLSFKPTYGEVSKRYKVQGPRYKEKE
jgi:hypothetical protein